MKLIKPTTTVFIPDQNGVPRSPSEGPFTVTDDYAAHLLKNGALDKDEIEDVEAPKSAKPAAKPAS